MAIPAAPSIPAITPPTYNASGTVNTSGVPASGTFTGPWFIEEQGLTFDYIRVPVGSLSAFDINLSAVTVTERFNQTVLLVEVNAYYRSRQDWTNYNTSAWQQPQTFSFLTFSADTQGNSYGDTTASTLGPMGSVITNQPFYNRRGWDAASGDSVVSKSAQGASYYMVDNPQPWTASAVEQTQYRDNFEYWWLQSDRAGTLLADWEPWGNHHWIYPIPGTYATNKESLWKIFQTIDWIGLAISNTQFYGTPVTLDASNYPMYTEGFSEYEISRHDYA